MNFVFDTSAIIMLIEICHLKTQLLQFSEWNTLLMPPRVKDEFLNGSVSPSDASTLEEIFSVAPVELDERLLPYFNFDASDGAIWVMSYACKHSDCCCVIDEEYGRKICELFGLEFTGAIGIITKMRKTGLLSDQKILEIKDGIRRSAFYYTEQLLSEFNFHDK